MKLFVFSFWPFPLPHVEPPSAESKPPPVGGMRGPMLMPGFDPTKARAGLKQTSKTNVAVGEVAHCEIFIVY